MNKNSFNGSDPRHFLKSIFDLTEGADDEVISREEIRASLKEDGIDPDVAWKKFSAALEVARNRQRLVEAREARLTKGYAQPNVTARVPVNSEPRETILKKLDQLFAEMKASAISTTGMLYARNYQETNDEDLHQIYESMKATFEREKSRTHG